MQPELKNRFEHAIALFDRGRVQESIQAFEQCRELDSDNPHITLNLAHAQSAAGEVEGATCLYRELLAGSDRAMAYAACWSLADLKGCRFTDAEVTQMQNWAIETDAHPQRFLLMFALGRALEQRGEHRGAFAALREANDQLAAERPFPGEAWRQLARSLESVNSIPVNESTPGPPTPVFIVGMPRSGSTLVEQILAAHSRVETVGEVPFLENLARSLDRQGGFANTLPRLTPGHCKDGAEAYLAQSRPLLEGNPDLLVDKWPDNFWYLGLARALFPESPIVNVWRDPLDNALAVYKQYFSHGNAHSSRLDWVAEYWETYLDVMGRWDSLLPGAILHLSYTQLVTETENTVRKLLGHCGLEFEQQVMTFHQADRAVMTPSGQQVRQPIYRSALGSAEPYRAFVGNVLPRFEALRERVKTL